MYIFHTILNEHEQNLDAIFSNFPYHPNIGLTLEAIKNRGDQEAYRAHPISKL